MIAEQLKKSILQAAIQGKLTQQLPEDGDARDLLKEIQKEKARLIKEGKIKKEKPLPEITEDEIPFEIPENWCWVRLGQIGDWAAGATPSRSNVEFYNNGSIPWLKTGDLNDGIINDVSEYITEYALKNTSVKLNPKGTVLIAMYGATIGKVGLLNIEAATNQACCGCRPIVGVFNWYLFYYLMSHKDDFISQGAGGAQPNISREKIVGNIIPLPPFKEQKRIVEHIEELLPEIESLKNDETKLEELQKSFPKKMKDAILQYAIQGKLTQQLPEDGDARDLLKEIQKEKARLIKEGKIKKEKPLPVITEDEIPFEIPENWCWVRLGEISDISAGTTPDRKYIIAKSNIHYYKVSDMNTQGNDKYMSIAQEYLSEQYPGKLLEPYTIIYPKNGGAVFTNKRRITTNKCLVDLNTGYCKPYNNFCVNYLFYWFLVLDLVNYYSGTALPTVSAGVIKNLLIPIPPLSEQNRIVACLEEFLLLCEELK